MENQEKKDIKSEEELEKTLYSTLNIGSFLEIKKKEKEIEQKEIAQELFSSNQENLKPLKPEEPPFEEVKKEEVKEVEVSIEPTLEETLEEKSDEVIPESKPVLEKTIDEIAKDMVEESRKKETTKEEPKKENKKEKKEKIGKRLFFGVIACAVLDFLILLGFFFTYGPISYFRNLLVTSAMTTQNHKYLARTFYSEKTIQKILESNSVKETGENTNAGDINFDDSKDTGVYESIYEEQILKRDKDQLYKVIDIKGSGYTGYLVAVYDASRVQLVGATSYGYGGALPTEIAKKNDAKVLINASGFINASNIGKGSLAVGAVIQDGKVVSRTASAKGYGGGIAGFNKDHVLVLTKDSPEVAIRNGIVDAVEFGPFLIVNGKAATINGNGGWGIAPRTVLAQRKDGIVLFLVIDGRNAKHSLGADMNELIKILTRYKAHNAVNLDGGGSSSLVVEGKLANIPCGSTCGERYIPNAWIVK